MHTEINLAECERAAGIGLEQFGEDLWHLRVLEYKRLIWTLACAFSGRHCECTHCEIAERQKRNAPRTIALCMRFTDGHTLDAFRVFLQRHLDLIPRALRDAFIMNIGWNDGSVGGVIITSDRVRRCTQAEVNAVGGEPIWNLLRIEPAGFDALRRLDAELLRATIRRMTTRPIRKRRRH